MTTHEEIAGVLVEYGEAIRGDWADLDGRTVRNNLEYLAGQVRDPQHSTAEMRRGVGICPTGNGHWTEYCDYTYSDCKEENW